MSVEVGGPAASSYEKRARLPHWMARTTGQRAALPDRELGLDYRSSFGLQMMQAVSPPKSTRSVTNVVLLFRCAAQGKLRFFRYGHDAGKKRVVLEETMAYVTVPRVSRWFASRAPRW